MKSKAAVVALCVCVILAVLGVVLGKSPALENTELPPSVSEKILSSQEISSESEASSAEVSTPAKTMKNMKVCMGNRNGWCVTRRIIFCVRKTAR